MLHSKNKESILTSNWAVCFLAIFCCLLWGSAFPSIKVGYTLFQISSTDIASQILFAGYRFTLAGILVIFFGSLLQRKFLYPKRAALPKVFLLCLLQTILQYFFFYIGLAHTTGVKGSIITASNTFLAILISSLLFKMEQLNKKKILGCILGFAGVILINLNGQRIGTSFNILGDGFIFCSATASACSSVLIKKYSQTINPVMLSGYQFVFGGLVMIVISFIGGGRLNHITVPGTFLLLYLAFLSAVAYTIWGILLKHNPVSKVAVFGFTNPVFGVILSALILGEGTSFGLRSIIALFLVCAGIMVVNYDFKK